MEPEQKSNGALIGLVIIVIILIIGGIYIWQSSQKASDKLKEAETQAQTEAQREQDAAALDSLEQDSNTLDVTTGVDVNTLK